MRIHTEGDDIVIVVEQGDSLRLTTPEHDLRTCIYVDLNASNNKIVFTGGASIYETVTTTQTGE